MLEYRFYSLQNQTNITIILSEDTYEEERGNDEYKIWNSDEMWGNEEEVRFLQSKHQVEFNRK